MRTVIITTADPNGILLDRAEIVVDDRRTKLSIVALEPDEEMSVADVELELGPPPPDPFEVAGGDA